MVTSAGDGDTMAFPVAGSTATDMAITATKILRIETIPIELSDHIGAK
jgi:hypothetical protein